MIFYKNAWVNDFTYSTIDNFKFNFNIVHKKVGCMEISESVWFGLGVIEECIKTSSLNNNVTIYELRIRHLNGFKGEYWYDGVANFPLEEGKLVCFQFERSEDFKAMKKLNNIF